MSGGRRSLPHLSSPSPSSPMNVSPPPPNSPPSQSPHPHTLRSALCEIPINSQVNSHPIEGSVGRDSSNSLSFPPSPLVEDSQNIPPSPSILSSSPSSKNHHKKSKDSPENLQSLSAKRVEECEEKRRISDDFPSLSVCICPIQCPLN